MTPAGDRSLRRLDAYRAYLDEHTALSTDPGVFGVAATRSRYESLRFVFEHFLATGGATVVELGTIRSFVHGGLPGCNEDDPALWRPQEPERWDWGAGCFGLMAAMCLEDAAPTIHTVDIASSHVERAKIVTAPYARRFRYHVADSVAFLRSLPPRSVDLLYVDTGDMWPIDPTARHQLNEVKAVWRGRLMSETGRILIDDVRNATPVQKGEESLLGKAKHSIPYLLRRGSRMAFDGYQAVLTPPTGTRSVFTNLYERAVWGGRPGDYYSGGGSDPELTGAYCDHVNALIASLEKQPVRVVDLGCGDFRVGARLVSPDVEYIGVDVVEGLIERNRRLHGSDRVEFRCLDIAEDDLPDGDVCLVRLVLQHLSNAEIQRILPKLRRYAHVFVTEHVAPEGAETIPNLDKATGAGIRLDRRSGVYVDRPPFDVPAEVVLRTQFNEDSELRTYRLRPTREP